MNDTINHITSMLDNLTMLRQINEANIAFMSQAKQILALQWLIGNIAIIAVFVIAIIAYRFANKATKAFAPQYVLPKRWLITLITIFAVTLIVFNILPNIIPVDLNLSPEMEKLVHETITTNNK